MKTINKPSKTLCTLEQAMAWGSGRMTRKMDGEFEAREINGLTVAGQLMRPKSGGFFTASDKARMALKGEFWVALDIVSNDTTLVRLGQLIELTHSFDGTTQTIVEPVENIADCMAGGAEGCVWQGWDWPYGQILAYKARWEGRCVVTGHCGGSQSMTIADAATGQPRGRITLRGGRCDRVRVGSIIKVNGMSLTDDGKIREPVLDNDAPDSWLVSF